uniref:Uncharacterized protein n=1 Tax=Solanum lycopersicum TaxID=4081 RepID=A0A3Q7IE52_SOLLC
MLEYRHNKFVTLNCKLAATPMNISLWNNLQRYTMGQQRESFGTLLELRTFVFGTSNLIISYCASTHIVIRQIECFDECFHSRFKSGDFECKVTKLHHYCQLQKLSTLQQLQQLVKPFEMINNNNI